uniref:Purple acid phosphatase n=1 Tax=Globisporangium ultimum (strain ATCC 200006 / CBS 805.95 / DAOM BR144) TaxID=431595 RepID=K3WGC0_GLOUD
MLALVLAGGVSLLLWLGWTTAFDNFASSNSSTLFTAKKSSPEAIAPTSSAPTQVHVALADQTNHQQIISENTAQQLGITVSWATSTQTKTSSVKFGLDPVKLTSIMYATNLSMQYEFCNYKSPWFQHVTIPGNSLAPSTTYYYQCGDDEDGWSDVSSFVTPVAVGSRMPITIGVIGDLGQTMYSEQTLRHLKSRTGMSAIVHAGDLSYADSNETRWDRWENLVQPLAAKMPWMISVENHEKERPCQKDVDPFVAYQVRFRTPFNPNDMLQRANLYYAFRVGMVHLIVVTPYVPFDASSPQYKWLEAELARVDRSVTPWVCVLMHGPWYNSNTAHQGMEPHATCTRMSARTPVFEGEVRKDGIIYVVLGGGGNREGLASKFIEPQPKWSAFRKAHYGLGIFKAVDATHGIIESYENQDVGDASLQDSAWITTTSFRVATDRIDEQENQRSD